MGAGKRVTMGNLFTRSGAVVDSYELDTNSPINLTCRNVIKGRSWKDPEVYAHLLKTIKDGKYGLVVPFQCAAVEILSLMRENEGIDSICVSDVSTSRICLRKDEFEKHFTANKSLVDIYPLPTTTPVVMKPAKGNASRGIKYLKKVPKKTPDDHIIQREIKGTEYSVDCYYSIYGDLIDYVPRIREEVTNGEVTKSITVDKDIFEKDEIIQRISREFKFRGPVCMQFIADQDNRLWIIEINCRLGGGATLSISSGLNMPEYMIGEYARRDTDFSEYISGWRKGTRVVRCYRDYYYEENSV